MERNNSITPSLYVSYSGIYTKFRKVYVDFRNQRCMQNAKNSDLLRKEDSYRVNIIRPIAEHIRDEGLVWQEI